jgi:hypothetical protein
MTPDVALLHAVERALAARGRTKFLERVGAWAPGPHRHQKWVLSDAEFRAVPLRGQMLREVRKDIVYFRLQKHVDEDGIDWTLDAAIQDATGECRCRCTITPETETP